MSQRSRNNPLCRDESSTATGTICLTLAFFPRASERETEIGGRPGEDPS
jgi:hypothetical protein